MGDWVFRIFVVKAIQESTSTLIFEGEGQDVGR
jgi:hypothetical protein